MINGIQQVGLGVTDTYGAWKWYREHLGFDVKIFDERAFAPLMVDYTRGISEERHAVLAMNLNGGGGYEIWQYVSRTPEAAKHDFSLLSPGILVSILKTRDAEASGSFLKNVNKDLKITAKPSGEKAMSLMDPYGNAIQVMESNEWYRENHSVNGGVEGVIIGVTKMEAALQFYTTLLGDTEIVLDETAVFEDLKAFPDGDKKFRRVVLKPKHGHGPFSPLLCPLRIELIQPVDAESKTHRYEGRQWGDLGYMHLCFDVSGMDEMKKHLESKSYPFTVDSDLSFDMGEAAGRFAYVEDPDGTLIELVETHKVPVMKKWGIYINLKKRKKVRALPRWMINTLGWNRFKG